MVQSDCTHGHVTGWSNHSCLCERRRDLCKHETLSSRCRSAEATSRICRTDREHKDRTRCQNNATLINHPIQVALGKCWGNVAGVAQAFAQHWVGIESSFWEWFTCVTLEQSWISEQPSAHRRPTDGNPLVAAGWASGAYSLISLSTVVWSLGMIHLNDEELCL